MSKPSAHRLIAVLVCALLGAFATSADAQWKWKDKTGRVQYSDLPPPLGTPETDILFRPGSRSSVAARTTTAPLPAASIASGVSPSASGALAPKTVDPELEARLKKAEAEQAAKVKAEQEKVAASKAENCKRARDNKRTFDSGQRIARVNEKGEREFLDDQQRAAEVKRTGDVIAADCK